MRNNNLNMDVFKVLFVAIGLLTLSEGLPNPAAKAQLGGEIPPLLSFKDGTIGVNFLGFKASAGLGGILNGDATQGGLHAEAETPFGQKAGAGLGGQVRGNGRSLGGLYAGATAGNGVGAAAGLGGIAGESGALGGSFATASGGGASRTVIKERFGDVGGSISDSLNIQKIPAAKAQVAVEVEEKPLAQPKKTYVERTVIPNYVEKTIQVPTYVEKTIRVPTVVEKKVKVPAPPTIIEKEVEVPQPAVGLTKTKIVHKELAEVPEGTVITRTTTKLRRRPWWYYNKHIHVNSGETPYYGGVVAGENSGRYSATYSHHFDGGNLIRNIFNIPIATLGAVSNLVGGVVGNPSGSLSVSKTYSY